MPHRPEAPHFVRQVRSVFHFCYAFLHCFCLYKCLPKSFFLHLLCFANFLRSSRKVALDRNCPDSLVLRYACKTLSKPSAYNQVLFHKTCGYLFLHKIFFYNSLISKSVSSFFATICKFSTIVCAGIFYEGNYFA